VTYRGKEKEVQEKDDEIDLYNVSVDCLQFRFTSQIFLLPKRERFFPPPKNPLCNSNEIKKMVINKRTYRECHAAFLISAFVYLFDKWNRMHRTSILKPLSLIKWKASFKKWELCAALV